MTGPPNERNLKSAPKSARIAISGQMGPPKPSDSLMTGPSSWRGPPWLPTRRIAMSSLRAMAAWQVVDQWATCFQYAKDFGPVGNWHRQRLSFIARLAGLDEMERAQLVGMMDMNREPSGDLGFLLADVLRSAGQIKMPWAAGHELRDLPFDLSVYNRWGPKIERAVSAHKDSLLLMACDLLITWRPQTSGPQITIEVLAAAGFAGPPHY